MNIPKGFGLHYVKIFKVKTHKLQIQRWPLYQLSYLNSYMTLINEHIQNGILLKHSKCNISK